MSGAGTAVVTGASRGIGQAIATRLARDGWRVLLAARDEAALKMILAELDAQHLDATWCSCDVADEGSVQAMVERAQARYGILDLLVNNAGIPGSTVPTTELSREEWDQVLATNLTGPMLCAKAVLPAMIERGSGHIVNIVSVTGKRPLNQRAAYAASKLGLLGFTRTVAEEVARHGVRVNAISPGYVEGERIKRVLAGQARARGISVEQARTEFLASVPLGRLIHPDEVAEAVVALHELSGVTGVDLNVAGGLVMY
jgi:NAD(P)-dependent dehydrogenase (short-subunit alcohol dehydrogenase family)